MNLSVAEFHGWRVACRNLVDHLRRQSRWWRSFGLWLWLGADGRLRGVVALPEISGAEFLAVFARRWPVSLHLVPPGGLRDHVAAVVSPGRIAAVGRSRYQHVRFSISPRRARPVRPSAVSAPAQSISVAPMPVLF
ncbi:hypothetical protein [Salinarimonas rosea]|uniref:hypothetical protein n=1 Tax=Salinarimonas rosea TaxID=552063 RepID=UPI0012EB73C6|nr:hypothetical protein [Salinarimonas rosea]